jgi:hypothetical protein
MKKSFLLAAALLVFNVSLFAQDAAGTWSGPFKSSGPAGTFDLTLSATADSGEITLKFGGRQAKAAIRDNKLESGNLTFASDLAGSDARFTATIRGTRMLGTFEVFENKARTVVGAFCMAKTGTPPCTDGDIPPIPNVQTATQRADESYDTSVKEPAYKSKGPEVLFDEAHKNFHKTTGNFKPFADLIRNDGYVITPNSATFSAAVLKGYDILIISNARGEQGASAFTDDEIAAVVEWVKSGGSLLLVADHTPFGGFSEKLANSLGIDMSKGYTDDPQNRDPVIKDLLFSRDNKLLGDHAITRGRSEKERINRIVSFTGQSLKSASGTPILKLADTAYDEFPNSDKKIPAAGRAQAIAIEFGKGKVFVSGEAAMLTAQLSAQDRKFGMNVEGIDNRQYAVNVVHWLSGLLK